MTYPGHYLHPIARTVSLHAPMVSGYVGARLYAQGKWPSPDLPIEDNATQFILENTGTGNFTLQMNQFDAPASGRTVLGIPVTLVPGGRRTLTYNPSGPYIEFKAVDASAGAFLKAQVMSKLRWDRLCFTEDEQPTGFNQAGYTPLASLPT